MRLKEQKIIYNYFPHKIKTKTMKQVFLIIIVWELAKLAIRTIFDKIVNE